MHSMCLKWCIMLCISRYAVDLSMDWISDKLYYVDNLYRHIGVVDLATNQYKILVSNADITYYIIVNPTTRLVHI